MKRKNSLELEELLKRGRRKKKITPAKIAVALMVLIGLAFLASNYGDLVGFFVKEVQTHEDSISQTFIEDAEYAWQPEYKGILKSVKIDGNFEGIGNFKISLIDTEGIGEEYVLAEGEVISGGDVITGFSVDEEAEIEEPAEESVAETEEVEEEPEEETVEDVEEEVVVETEEAETEEEVETEEKITEETEDVLEISVRIDPET